MPYWRLFYHLAWSTKRRAPIITEAIACDLYRLMTGKAQELGALVYAVGGVADHVHLAASVPPALALAEFVGQVKGVSAHGVNKVLLPDTHFAWQAEYGVVSFGGKQLDMVVKYVLDQRQHHELCTTIPFLERVAPPATESRGRPACLPGASRP